MEYLSGYVASKYFVIPEGTHLSGTVQISEKLLRRWLVCGWEEASSGCTD